jgi:hypothetical protein
VQYGEVHDLEAYSLKEEEEKEEEQRVDYVFQIGMLVLCWAA